MRRKKDLEVEEQSAFIVPHSNYQMEGKTAEEIGLHANKKGYLKKRNNSWFAYLFPYCFNQWKSRYVVIAGSYLFKFESETSVSNKGVPIPVSSIQATYVVGDKGEHLIELKTIRKMYVFKAVDRAECFEWIKSVNERRAQAIREDMGHVRLDEQVAHINKIGAKLFDEKLKKEGGQQADVGMIFNPMLAGR